MKLYHYWRSSCSWRVRWALLHKGISFETHAINLLTGEHKSKEFLSKNPLGFVPVLELDDGTTLSESWSILEWIEEHHPTPALLPIAPLQKQRCRALASIIFSATQPLQNPSVFKKHSQDKQQQKEWASHFISNGLKAYSALRKSWNENGSHSIGKSLSLADLCLIPQIYNARRFEVDLSGLADLLKIEESCKAGKNYDNAHPDAFSAD